MAQVGMAGVSAAMAYVTGPTPSEVPSKRIQDQQSSRPVKESEEADQDSDQGADVIFETSEPMAQEYEPMAHDSRCNTHFYFVKVPGSFTGGA